MTVTAPTTEISTNTRRFNAKREAIVSAASTLFSERGIVGTTLSDVAESVALIKNSVTYYFRRKEDLVVACFARSIDVMNELVTKAAALEGIEARVGELIRLQIETQGAISDGAHPPTVAFHEIRALPEPLSASTFAAFTDLFRRVRGLLSAPESSGWPRTDLNARAHILMTILHSVRVFVWRYEPEDRPRLARRLSDIVLYGVGAPNSTWVTRGSEAEWLSQVPERDLNAQFLRVVTDLMNEQGYAGASVNRIAEKMNLTKGGFYYYNENKDDLVERVFERTIATMRKAINLTEAYGGNNWDHLCSIIRGLVGFQISPDGPMLRSVFNSALPNTERVKTHRELTRMHERIAGVVIEGQIDGSVRLIDATLVAEVLLPGVMAASELHRWTPGANADNACDLYAYPMLNGLVSPIRPSTTLGSE